MRDLTELRKKIDETDRKLLELFLSRMELCEEVAEYKKSVGMPILDTNREREVLEEKRALLKNPAFEKESQAFFTSIMAISRDLQKKKLLKADTNHTVNLFLEKNRPRVEKPTICYFGTSGSYSEEAAVKYFGEETNRFSVPFFQDALLALENNKADYAVLPLENSSTGGIADVMDLLKDGGFYIVGEVYLPIQHCLLGKKGAKISQIRTIYSHEQGFLQSGNYLKSLQNVKLEVSKSTAESAKWVSEKNDFSVAAIAGTQNAAIYGLEVLEEKVNDNSQNMTRFAVFSRKPEIVEACNKISILFTLPHESGELHRVMSCFARGGLNLLKLESRPIPEQRFQYMFFLDYEGNLQDQKVRKITEEVVDETEGLRILGNYPSGQMEG